jgi:hypothetical protein
MLFNLVHVVPDYRYHGMFGYREVMETLAWGLTELGHPANLTLNSFSNQDRRNIIVGGHVLHREQLQQLPPETIFYNLEQIRGLESRQLKPTVRLIAERFNVWDYNEGNVQTWRQINPNLSPTLVPIGWHPGLQRIPKRPDEDIDVLFYGRANLPRFEILERLCHAGLKVMYVSGFYGPQRDELISRAKIVLNLNLYQPTRVFEVVRVSYLLANEKAIVSDIYPETDIEPDLKEACVLVPREKILDECTRLLTDNSARADLARRGRQIMEKRDIREILRPILASLKP